MTISEIQDFTGGVNTIEAPHLIAPQEARQLINVDIRRGSLQSMPNLNHIQDLDGDHFVEFEGVVYSYMDFRSNVEWDGKLYWADGLNTGKIMSDGTELPLGIITPTVPATQTEAGVSPNGVHTGHFKYTYTYYSTETGVESAPSPLPNYLEVLDDNIIISALGTLPPDADRYRIYRIGGYLTLFTLVKEIETTDLPFTDDIDDTKVDGRLLQTLYTNEPPANLSNLVELNGRMYGSVGNKLFYSAQGNPDAWYVTNFFTLPTVITAVAKAPAGLLVMTNYTTSLLQGTLPNNFHLKQLSDQLGCVGQASVAQVADSAVWLSHNGFCMANGYRIEDITASKIDNLADLYPTGACVHNQVYYLSFKPALFPEGTLYPSDLLYPGATQGTLGIDQGIIALDFKRGRGFSYKIINYPKAVAVGIVNGQVYVSTGAPNEIFIFCEEPLGCDDFIQCSAYSLNRMNIYELDTGLTSLIYLSPKFTDGGVATLKEYDKIRINFRGKFNVKVLFSNSNIILDQDIESIGADVDTFEMLGIPNKENKSYSISFLVTGEGTVRSIQYSWQPRGLA